jgi:PAS domain S-box-containing protein
VDVEAAVEIRPGEGAMGGLRLIIVAADDGEAELIARTLQAEGYQLRWHRVDTVAGLDAAVRDGPVDLVIVHDRPELAADAARRVVWGAGDEIPFIVISDIGADTAPPHADEHVPADEPYRLVPVVRRELRQARSRRERRSTEEALRRHEADLRLLAEHTRDIIFRCRVHPAFEITYLSPAVTRVTGATAGELRGDPGRFLGHIPDPVERAALEASWRTGRGTDLVVGWRRADGSTVWLEQRAEASHTIGRLTMVEGILRDVTDRVRAEHEQERLLRQLQEAERLESLGRLAGGVAHEFTNALCVIGNSAAFLAEDLPADHTGRADIDRILDTTRRSAALTHQLLVFARRQPERAGVVEVDAVLAGIEDLIRRTVGATIELTCEFGATAALISVDRGRFEQALVNLVANARAAMPDGGRLRIRTDVVEFTPVSEHARPGRHVRIRVDDSGEGMPADVAGRAFEPYFTTRPAGAGPGLGLAMVYGVVRAAGGHITLDSEPGRGTVVTIHLPLAQAPPARPVRRPPTAVRQLRPAGTRR